MTSALKTEHGPNYPIVHAGDWKDLAQHVSQQISRLFPFGVRDIEAGVRRVWLERDEFQRMSVGVSKINLR